MPAYCKPLGTPKVSPFHAGMLPSALALGSAPNGVSSAPSFSACAFSIFSYALTLNAVEASNRDKQVWIKRCFIYDLYYYQAYVSTYKIKYPHIIQVHLSVFMRSMANSSSTALLA